MDKENIVAYLGVPEVGYLILTIFLVLAASPYLAGQDFGLIKIPNFPKKTRKTLVLIGPLLILAGVLLHIPFITIKLAVDPKLLAKKLHQPEYLQIIRVSLADIGAGGGRETEEQMICRYVLAVANDAKEVAAVWNEIQRELAETVLADDREALERILDGHSLMPLLNVRPFSRLSDRVRFLETFYNIVDRVSGQNRGAGLPVVLKDLPLGLLRIVNSRGQVKSELDKLIADNFTENRTVINDDNLRRRIRDMRDLVEALQSEAAALRVLAESVQCYDSPF